MLFAVPVYQDDIPNLQDCMEMICIKVENIEIIPIIVLRICTGQVESFHRNNLVVFTNHNPKNENKTPHLPYAGVAGFFL